MSPLAINLADGPIARFNMHFLSRLLCPAGNTNHFASSVHSVTRYIVAHLSPFDRVIPNLKQHHHPDLDKLANTPSMLSNRVDPKPIHRNENDDDDDDTTDTIITPPETVATDLLDDHDPLAGAGAHPNLVPWPDSTYIIRSVPSGHVLTLHDGQIALSPPGGPGSIHWACVETKGWLGFRNTVSGKLLGHDKEGRLCCLADRHLGWERFCVRMRPQGGCVMLMTHWEGIWHVGIKVERGVGKLAKIGEGGAGGMTWEFVRV